MLAPSVFLSSAASLQLLQSVIIGFDWPHSDAAVVHTGASFQLFLGGPNFFFIFQCHRTIEKLEKNSTLYVVI